MINLNNYPQVSILLPTYNAEKYIDQTLESIRDQEYPNIQIVIFDDCSSDNTALKINNFIEKNKNINIFFNVNKKNLGVTRNCNAILAKCTGKYISFFAGDDFMRSDKILKQVIYMENNPNVSFCYHAVNIFDQSINKVIYSTSLVQKYFKLTDLLILGGIMGACSVFSRSNSVPSYGFDSRYPVLSDWKMQIDLSLRGKIGFIPQKLCTYRKHSGGLSSNARKFLEEGFCLLNDLKSDAKINKIFIWFGFYRLFFGEFYRCIYQNKKENFLFLTELAHQYKLYFAIVFLKLYLKFFKYKFVNIILIKIANIIVKK